MQELTRIHRVNIIERDSTKQRDNGMLGWLAVKIRIVELGQFPRHSNPSAGFDFRCGRFGDHFRGQDGELPKAFFMTAGLSSPDLLGVWKFVEGNIKKTIIGHVFVEG